MNYFMISIYDKKAANYSPPSFFRHQSQAARAFLDNLQNPGQDPQAQLMSRHTADYDLYYLGTYDDDTGKMQLEAQPQFILNGAAHFNEGA